MKTVLHPIINFLGIIFYCFFLSGCIINYEDDPSLPTTSKQIAESVDENAIIITDGCDIIEEAISTAFSSDDFIDPYQIAEQIESLEGVKSSEPTSSGTGIVIQQDDGTFTNLLIITQDDERLFIESNTKSVTSELTSEILFKVDPVVPNGDGKAIILAPFQSSFKTDLNQISSLLNSAGYKVDIYTDSDATLSKFRGDNLNNYDVVFIRTHGAANWRTRGGDISTVLLTGERFTSTKTESLSIDEQRAIATGGHGGISYFAISVPWLNLTTDQDFTNSWIYAGGCETAMVDNGNGSLSEAFLNLNAAGYNGFDASILTAISNPVAEKMTAIFTSGLTFTDASDEVRNDIGLRAKSWLLRIRYGSPAEVGLFDNNKNFSDPFYLFDPSNLVGTARVIPDAGPVGTPVVFEVIINEAYVNRVTSIEFDIDNTGEHLIMYKVNSNTWQQDDLVAPEAQTYPRIDTFTFSAYDSDGNLVGQGSATFSILERSAVKNSRTNHYSR